jgi:DNA polymerase-3 subunit delta
MDRTGCQTPSVVVEFMDALSFLDRPRPQPLFVVYGDEDFLRRLVLAAIRKTVLGDGDDEFSCSVHPGDKATYAAVVDELQTVPFFGEHRLVVVENADPFVTRYRATLEKLVADLPATGVLVLDVKSWPRTTRLAKLVDAKATIECKAPPASRLPQWCVQWAAARQQKQLTALAAALLVELAGPEMGLLDQELLKLALYVGDRKRIDEKDVDMLVGRSRAENTWKIFDAIGAGQPGDALTLLDRLLDQGEDPHRLLGAFSSQLRRLAQAARLTQQGRPVVVALEEAGIPPFGVRAGEQQLRHLGVRRAARLYDWLLEVDLGVKGGSQLSPRTLLERLVLRLAQKEP